MGYVLKMPQLGMSMDEGTLVEWTVDVGAPVAPGDTVAIVESEKTQAEVAAREEGVLRQAFLDTGDVAPPGEPIGVVAAVDANLESLAPELAAAESVTADVLVGESSTQDVSEDPDAESPVSTAGSDHEQAGPLAADALDSAVRATPGARKLAGERDVTLDALSGSSPDGVVTEADVRSFLESAQTQLNHSDEYRASPGARRLAAENEVALTAIDGSGPTGVIVEADVAAALSGTDGSKALPAVSEGEAVPGDLSVVERRELSGMQATISERLSRSDREAVPVTLHRSFATSELESVVDGARERGVSVSFMDLLLKAVGEGLAAHPDFNGHFTDEALTVFSESNIGVAIDVDRGLVTPVVTDVGERSVEEVNERRVELTRRARTDDLGPDEVTGGTFTVSNLGVFDVDQFDPVINPPEVAILGVGRIRDDEMTLSLTFDHRVVNGADAARFLDTIVDQLEQIDALASFFSSSVSPATKPGADERRAVATSDAGYAGSYQVGGSSVAFDEPESVGGTGTAPSPIQHLVGALGSCMLAALRSVAARDSLDLGRLTADVTAEPESGPLSAIDVQLSVASDEPDEVLDSAVTKAERLCLVSRALGDDCQVTVTWTKLE